MIPVFHIKKVRKSVEKNIRKRNQSFRPGQAIPFRKSIQITTDQTVPPLIQQDTDWIINEESESAVLSAEYEMNILPYIMDEIYADLEMTNPPYFEYVENEQNPLKNDTKSYLVYFYVPTAMPITRLSSPTQMNAVWKRLVVKGDKWDAENERYVDEWREYIYDLSWKVSAMTDYNFVPEKDEFKPQLTKRVMYLVTLESERDIIEEYEIVEVD